MKQRSSFLLLGLLLVLALPGALSAQSGSAVDPDVGMWPYDSLPLDAIERKHGFRPSAEWIERARLSSVRVSTGGSGSFISPHGLVMTNHHVALELIQKLSLGKDGAKPDPAKDYVKNGFLARTREEELPCPPGTELLQLISMTDVSSTVEEATKGLDAVEAASVRAQVVADLKQEREAESGQRVEIVPLYGGSVHKAYHYRVWTDVRLVWAPEAQVGYWGGDYDNFTYPRYNLDATFLRAYEDGKPADTSAFHFGWNAEGPKEGEVVFVSGNPGRTSRLWPLSRLEHERDVRNPIIVAFLAARDRALTAQANRGEAERLEILDELFGIRNSLKAYGGMLRGLRDDAIWQRKVAEDTRLREAVANDPAAKEAFATFERSVKVRDETTPYLFLYRLDGPLGAFATNLVGWAKAAQAAGEMTPALESARDRMMLSDDIDMELQTLRLMANLDAAANAGVLGDDDPFLVGAFMGEESPEAAARRIMASTRLVDPDYVEALLAEGPEAVLASKDSFLSLAKVAVPKRNEVIARYRAAEAEETAAMTGIARARFAAFGDSVYPDATFTLRMAIGVVKGYELGTTLVPWKTTLYGLYARHHELAGQKDWDLPQSWIDAEERIDLTTPINFVSTNDIIGGNSGSPVFDKSGNIVGLVFDGNIQSLPNNYLHLADPARSVSVHSAGIIEALDEVYRAYNLLAEIGVR